MAAPRFIDAEWNPADTRKLCGPYLVPGRPVPIATQRHKKQNDQTHSNQSDRSHSRPRIFDARRD
jgi:hypothetical protein